MNLKPSARFWENVTNHLETRGMSVRALAREVGITPGAMSKYSRGTSPSLDVAVRIAEVLDMSLEKLLSDSSGSDGTKPSSSTALPGRPPRRIERHEAEKLIESLGLGRLALLASRSSWKQEQDILWLLQKQYPAGVPFQDIRSKMKETHPAMSARELAACLALLVERGQVEERPDGCYGVPSARSHLATRPVLEEFVLELIQVLVREVYPVNRTNPDRGTMLLWRAHVSKEKAAIVTKEIRAATKEILSQYTDPDGDQEFVVVAAAAVPDAVVSVTAQQIG